MKRTWSRRAKIIGWTAVAVTAVLVASAIGAVVAVRVQLSGITHIAKVDITHRPPKYTSAVNILLLGSDTRSGRNGRIGGRTGCNCSDTIMLVHISPGPKSVTVLSIPRDTVVPYYACAAVDGLPGQAANPYALERINATLAAGGPECVRETVERQTGIYIDNVIELDFVGFQKVISDIGGVNVCLPFAIHNRITADGGSGLNLTAGEHHINGRVALQFWRTRYDVANGSDIARIARDQYLMAQVVKGVLRSGLLHSPTKLYTVIGDVADAMTTDASDTELLHIALSLRGIAPRQVQFITAPWTSYLPDPNEVQFEQPQADAVFWAIAHDTALPKRHKHRIMHPAQNAGKAMSVDPAQVKVRVLDGSSGADRATATAAALSSRGFTVLGTGYAPAMTYTASVIEYGSAADRSAADTLAGQFSAVTLKLVPGIARGALEVILGSSFARLASPRPTSGALLHSLSASYGGITAAANCRNDAFYGTYDPPSAGSASCAC